MTTTDPADNSSDLPAPQPDAAEDPLLPLLADLTKPAGETRLEAVRHLAGFPTPSEAVLRALERVAGQDDNPQVQATALEALARPAYRALQQKLSRFPGGLRPTLLAEIERWAADQLISTHTASLLRQRYDFTIPSPQPAAPPIAKPQPTLSQVLLSETTIKVALYLGAFFVISAACILATIFEFLRLPVLGLATAGFGGGALVLKRRLPQASFILFTVFSFLLPIDAAVILDYFSLSSSATWLYWSAVTGLVALVWTGGTWFYTSRFFSVLALAAAATAALLLGRWLDRSPHLDLFLIAGPTLAGLGGVWLLHRWQPKAFALPLLVLTQLQQLGLLGVSTALIGLAWIDGDLPAAGWWAVIAATWLLGALFFAGSERLTHFQLFPPLAVAALLPVPAMASGLFSPTTLAVTGVTCGWGALLALAGEGVWRVIRRQDYALYLLLGSMGLFAAATLLGLTERVAAGLACLVVATLVYAGLAVVRPRAWVWGSALVAGVLAYFTAFFLPRIEAYEFYPGFITLWPALGLAGLSFVSRRYLQAGPQWHLPPLIVGSIAGGVALLTLAATGFDEPGRAAIAFIIIALFLTLVSLLDQKPLIGYGATAGLAAALALGLVHFEQETWLVPLVALAGLYFGAGFGLTWLGKFNDWSTMLRWSGLGLGALVALSAPLQGGAAAVIGTALVATFFAVEAFYRRNIWLGFPANLLYLGAYFILLVELEVTEPQVYSIGAALLGFIMHYLLVRRGLGLAAFLTGLVSQLILLSTTYIQMLGTDRFLFFFVLFAQALVVLGYGLVVRSRSLVIAPLVFVVLGVVTVTLSVLAGLPALILIGCTGLLLLLLGIMALVMRERLLSVTTRLGERLGGWQA